MAEQKKTQRVKATEPERLYYAVIPDYRTNESGEVIKPVFQDTIIYKNTRDQVIDNIHTPGVCLGLDPDAMGMYVVDLSSEDAELMQSHMNARVRDETYPIIGPFKSLEEALSAQEEARPKTDKELLDLYKAKYPDGV